MYSRDQIEQVRSSVDLIDVIRSYVPSLKVVGRSVRGLCPFHQEKTASFYVHPEKGLFKCFGCGESGDVIAFISKIEQVKFAESLEQLAAKAGIVLQKSHSPQKKQEESLKDQLYRACELASVFYEEQLWDSPEGKSAQVYLSKRSVTSETARYFHLGYAPTRGESVFEQLVKKGIPVELCQKAGLAARSAAGRFYDPMFGRLIFPIFDNFGHVVGFGGRILPEKKKKSIFGPEEGKKEGVAPKYLNSPETPIFSKGKLLYGLFQGKSNVMSDRRVVILEGYMDVIGVHQAGFPQAVATLGTALTRDHAKLLRRYADEVVAFFDPDEAGKRAALRGVEPLLQESLFPKVVAPEDALDPDEYILKHGLESFQQRVDSAPDFVNYLIKISKGGPATSLQEKSKLAQQILSILAKSPNEILKTGWTAQISAALQIPLESLATELSKQVQQFSRFESEKTVYKRGAPKIRIPTVEEEYLQLVIQSSEIWNELGLTDVDFKEGRNRRLFRLIQEQLNKTGQLSAPAIHDQLEGEEKDWFMQLVLEEKHFEDPKEIRDQFVRDIRMKKQKERLTHLSRQVALGQANEDERSEYLHLLRQVKGSDRGKIAERSENEVPVTN